MGEVNKGTQLVKLVNSAFRAMLGGTKDMIFVKDANLVYVAASLPFVRMTGKEREEQLVSRTDMEIFEDADLAKRYISDDRKLMAAGRNLLDYVEPITDEDGHARYGSTSKYILRDDLGEIIGILGITRDITRDYIARQQYQRELKYLFTLPSDTYAVSYIDVDSWRVISQRRQDIGGGSLQACFTVEELCEAAVASIVDGQSEVAEFYRNFTPGNLRNIYSSGRSTLTFTYQRRLTNGSICWVHNSIRFLMDAENGHMCAMISTKDIDAEKRREQRLIEEAQIDGMTMLLNRTTTMATIDSILEEEADQSHVLFMIDLDNFKNVNDNYGHQTGDRFLMQFATEIRKHFRKTDVVGRVGGDEFFVLMKNVSGTSEIAEKAEEVLAAIQKVCVEYAPIPLSGSIGISLFPENGKTLEELYFKADTALYEAKRKGKNRYIYAS